MKYTITMHKNIGTFDRLVRMVIGIICIILAIVIVNSLIGKIILILAGIFCFYEAFSSWCLFYQIIGRTTCPIEK